MAYKDIEKRNAFFRNRYATNVQHVANLKIEKGCSDCGYNAHPAGLEFDHILPRVRGTVASQMGKSLNVILEEIDQCEVVCCNCHAIREYERAKGIRTDGSYQAYQDRTFNRT